MKRTTLPPALRSIINRAAHDLAGLHEVRQRRELTNNALKQWQAGASVEAVAQTIQRQQAVARLQDVAPGG